MRWITIALVALALSGCQTRQERVAMLELRSENRRLNEELSKMNVLNKDLSDQNESLAAEITRLRSKPEPVAQPQTFTPSPAATNRGPLQPVNTLPTVSAISGNWVVVLASVGAGHADGQRGTYADTASQLNKRYGGQHGAAFGTRTPRSGGLQLIYGVSGGAYGVSKAKAESVRGAMTGRYRDAYLLNLD